MQDWLAHRAAATPGREALVNAASGNAWSYATLDETVEEMSGRLRGLGVEQGDHLAAVLGTGAEAVCLVHAAMRLGTTLVPLSPEFTPPELRERLTRADAHAIVCDAATEPTVQEATTGTDAQFPVFTIDDPDWAGATPIAGAEPTEFSPAEWSREDVQLLLFTSGTTGEPKAVQLTMGNLLASAAASAFRLGIDPEDRWLVPLSLHHMGGIAPFLRSALYGTTAVVRPSFDPGGTVDDLRSYEATCVSLVPTMLRRMLRTRGTLPDCLRFVLVGGAPCPEELIDRCRDFSVPVCPTYGMTETASQVATARHREAYEHPGSVGRPLLWTDVTVVDETGSPVEAGETGELVVDGPTVTPGYYDDHAATGEAMGTYGLHTGDVGYQDDQGRLYVLNRLDDRILTGGENVDPGEVVDALQAYDGVAEAAVVGLPDDQWGEQVAALVVPENEAEPPELEALEAFLRERLAGFKLPRTVGLAEELPRTVSGTVEREAVREQLQESETRQIERSVDSARASASERPAADDGALPAADVSVDAEPADEESETDEPAELAAAGSQEESPESPDAEPLAPGAVEDGERASASPADRPRNPEPSDAGTGEDGAGGRAGADSDREEALEEDHGDPEHPDPQPDELPGEPPIEGPGDSAESVRKGGAVLSEGAVGVADDEQSSVTAERGAALGTGRSDEAGVEEDADGESTEVTGDDAGSEADEEAETIAVEADAEDSPDASSSTESTGER